MAYFDSKLGVWKTSDGRGAYATRESAEAAEGAAATNVVDDDDFALSFGQPANVLRPAGQGPGITPEQAAKDQAVFEESNRLRQLGYSDLNNDNIIDAEDVRLSGVPYGTPTSQGGTAQGFKVIQRELGARDARIVNGRPTRQVYSVQGLPGEGAEGYRGTYSFTSTPGGSATSAQPAVTGGSGSWYDAQGNRLGVGPAAQDAAARSRGAAGTGAAGQGAYPVDSTSRGEAAASQTQRASDKFESEHTETEFENNNLFADAMRRYNALTGPNNALSDEARAYQQEGLQQQRMLLEKLLGFDEEQYATQFADQALARTIAAGRMGTSAAEQQVGRFAAMEQAPALYAEGRRQASELANQRLGLAEAAAKSFGELGTMTRGQDETRAQFEAQLPLEIANSVAALTQGKMNLNQQDAEMFAQIWMDFAQLQSVYAGMSSEEQIAWWQNETQRRGQDKQFQAIMEELNRQGKIADRDLINGLFQLGGGILSLGGGLGAA